MSQAAKLLTVGILIFDEVEVLDFCGPFEVFSAARPPQQHDDGGRLFHVMTIAEEQRIISCRGGLLVQPHATIDEHPALDILVVPGGQGTRRERHNQHILQWIARQAEQNILTSSVCTGAFLLAESQLLRGRKATTHWHSVEWMRENYKDIEMLADQRIVDEGDIVTSAGVSAGIDMSLHLVARFYTPETAQWTARRMEYDWRP